MFHNLAIGRALLLILFAPINENREQVSSRNKDGVNPAYPLHAVCDNPVDAEPVRVKDVAQPLV